MKKTSFKDQPKAEIMKRVKEMREELRAMRFSAAGARMKNPSAAAKLKSDIARAMTELGK